jgi:hypothetical protein
MQDVIGVTQSEAAFCGAWCGVVLAAAEDMTADI